MKRFYLKHWNIHDTNTPTKQNKQRTRIIESIVVRYVENEARKKRIYVNERVSETIMWLSVLNSIALALPTGYVVKIRVHQCEKIHGRGIINISEKKGWFNRSNRKLLNEGFWTSQKQWFFFVFCEVQCSIWYGPHLMKINCWWNEFLSMVWRKYSSFLIRTNNVNNPTVSVIVIRCRQSGNRIRKTQI